MDYQVRKLEGFLGTASKQCTLTGSIFVSVLSLNKLFPSFSIVHCCFMSPTPRPISISLVRRLHPVSKVMLPANALL